ncbi:MAG: ATP-binding protein [Gammaproteobacteria bacterium]|nr:ATP-binding protein [Gammaproteobacteria bacterium]
MEKLRKMIDVAGLLKPGIGRKFALFILLFSSVVTLVSTIVQLTIEFKRDVGDIERSLVQIRTSYSESLAGSLWVVSKQDVKLQLDGILRLPDMQYLEVRNENDDIVSKVGTFIGVRVLREETPLFYKHQDKLVFVGTLISIASLEGAYQRLIDKALVILLSQTIKTFLVSFFIIILFQYLIGRHLAKIARHSEVLDAITPEQNLELDRDDANSKHKDELSHVVSAINKMRCRLSNAFRKLLHSEENTRMMVESVQDYAIFRLDVDGHISTWNSGAQRIFGYAASEIIGKPYSVFFLPHDIENNVVRQLLENSVKNNRAESAGLRTRKDGTAFWAEGTLTALFDSSNTPKGFSSVTRDITERKTAEKEQQRLNRALRLLSDCNLLLVNAKCEYELLTGVCQLIVNTGGYIAAWVGVPENDQDKTVKSVTQHGFDQQFFNESPVSWDESLSIGRGPTGIAIRTRKPQFFQQGQTNSQILPWRSTAEKHGIQSGLAMPMISGDELIGILSLYSSDPMAFTQAEVNLFEELIRNIVFGIERLRSIEKHAIAEAASEAKSTFLANMSHEIRTPLNAILGSTQLLRRENPTPKQSERLDTIDTAGEHLLDIINAVLDLSKIEAGKFFIESRSVSVVEIMAGINSLMEERATAKHLSFKIEIEKVPKLLVGDATRIKQALINYVGNAIKFTEKGMITVRATTLAESDDDAVIRFEVEDTGIGIADENIHHLFTAFEQIDSTSTRKYGGTGLGLAITKKLAELMGGDAGVESKPGIGSKFWFTAHLKKEILPRAEHSFSDNNRDQIDIEKDFSRNRVLIVDDEPVNRKLLIDILKILNPQVDQAENGSEAVELIKNNPYDLIFMDMQMPVMNGLDATRRIRMLPNGKTVPIIALTGNAFYEDRLRCLEAGMTEFVSKPFSVVQLLSNVRRWLSETVHSNDKELV